MKLLYFERSGERLSHVSLRLERTGIDVAESGEILLDAAGLNQVVALFSSCTADGYHLVTSLASDRLVSRIVDIPMADPDKLREVLSAHLSGTTTLPVDRCVFDVLPIPSGGAFVLWTELDVVTSLIGSFAGDGYEPEVVTAAPCHWMTLLHPVDPDRITAITDGATLVAFRDNAPLLLRYLGQGDVVAEIIRTLAVLGAGEDQPPSVALLGVAQELSGQLLHHGVTLVTVPEPFDYHSSLVCSAVAVGRAYRAGTLLDFRRGGLAPPGRAKRQRFRRILLLSLVACVCLIMIGDGFWRYRSAHARLASLDKAVLGVYRELFPSRSRAGDELAEARAELKRLGGSRGMESALLPLLKSLADLRGDAPLLLQEVETDGPALLLRGEARSVAQVEGFRTRIGGIIRIGDPPQITTRADGAITFTLRGTLKRQGGEGP